MFSNRMLAAVLLMFMIAPAWAVDYPIGGNKVRMRETPQRRTFMFRSTHQALITTATIADPTVGGATLEVFGSNAGDGNTGIISLPAAQWKAMGNGYYFQDRSAPFGVKQVRIMGGANGGWIKVGAGGPNWPYLPTQPQGVIRVRLSIGGDVYCARFTDLNPNLADRVIGKKNPAPADCT